jgi:hypothetical protein
VSVVRGSVRVMPRAVVAVVPLVVMGSVMTVPAVLQVRVPVMHRAVMTPSMGSQSVSVGCPASVPHEVLVRPLVVPLRPSVRQMRPVLRP